MNYIKSLLVALLVTLSFAFAQDTYASDPIRTFVFYRAQFGTFGYEMGKFEKADFTFTVDPNDASKSSVEFTVDAGSINTGNDQRNSDMTGPDMLDAVQFPTITFKSTSVKDTGEGNLEVTGDLTVKDTTKPVTVQIQKVGEGDDFQGMHRIGYYLQLSIDRTEHGLTGFEDAVGNTIDLTIAANGIRQ
jgi:polyisoprenoid-binding protein YceI